MNDQLERDIRNLFCNTGEFSRDEVTDILVGLIERIQHLEQLRPEQEPVTWRNAALRVGEDLCSVGPFCYYDMTAEQWLDWALSVVTVHEPPRPQKRTWVGLSDDEIFKLYMGSGCTDIEDCEGFEKVVKVVEAKLKDKNT